MMRRIMVGAGAVILFCVLVVVFRLTIWPDRNAVLRLEDLEERPAALLDLLERNKIRDLPEGFTPTGEGTRIECFRAGDRTGRRYYLVMVTYPVEYEGQRTYSFVFNGEGRCVLHCGDRKVGLNGGLLDLTGDGYPEKVVSFTEDGAPYGMLTIERFQIFTFRSGQAEKLLDVVYNLRTSMYEKGSLTLHILPRDHVDVVTLNDLSDRTKSVEFLWSDEQQKFIAEGPTTDNWKILFPSE